MQSELRLRQTSTQLFSLRLLLYTHQDSWFHSPPLDRNIVNYFTSSHTYKPVHVPSRMGSLWTVCVIPLVIYQSLILDLPWESVNFLNTTVWLVLSDVKPLTLCLMTHEFDTGWVREAGKQKQPTCCWPTTPITWNVLAFSLCQLYVYACMYVYTCVCIHLK